MAPERFRVQQHLTAFQFKTLFLEELGWDHLQEPPLRIALDNHPYTFLPLAEKRGVKVYQCGPNAQGKLPDARTLSALEREITQHAYEHLVIYVDATQQEQLWQWERREQGKPRALRRHRLHRGQSGEALALRLLELAVAIEEEASLSTLAVSERTRRAFDVEKVTKKFYDRFQKEHDSFLALIQGIEDGNDCSWYASLMLNRLMFVYFIQKKGLLAPQTPGQLDGDVHYLRNRLTRMQQRYGQDQFYSFYRFFLLRLFHEGLSQHEGSRDAVLHELLGHVPYLNGGLFDVHQLERTYPAIQIPDEAFTRLFTFFDEFEWHLDTRQQRNDREINPDVLGYIFEKYINQKQMGAYYTKEDITEYISKNTIIPYLFDAAERACLVAFTPDGPVWSLLRENPDRYIYEAVKKGCDLPLPAEIERGVQEVSLRGEWNKAAPEEYALPTETWREVVARRTRYAEVRAKLAAGEVHSINELITYNLDICRFAEEVIAQSEGVDLLRAFYDSIEQVSVLDPTCGSGAFLFAALNILQPLYLACLDRMHDLVEEREQLDALKPAERRPMQARPSISRFREILQRVAQHPSRDYFVLKSIIINNLYGVDIMEEAVEICKLRLFLKLVSQVERSTHLEPLPDIDFNIRAGNTLVGFASYEEARQVITGQFDFDNTMERIEQRVKEIERGFAHFRALQTEIQLDTHDMGALKRNLREQLTQLNRELNVYLASQYGIDRHNIKNTAAYEQRFAEWQRTHQPLHWFAEFYGIMARGGFDVIIGNPPYVEYKNVKDYSILHYDTKECGDLFAFTLERGIFLTKAYSTLGYIVPLSAFTVDGFKTLQNLYSRETSYLYVSNWSGDAHPSKFFEGVDKRLEILIAQKRGIAQVNKTFTSKYLKWYSEERQNLFFGHPIYYPINPRTITFFTSSLLKIETSLETQLVRKMLSCKKNVGSLTTTSGQHFFYYTRKASFFLQFLDFIPEVRDNAGNLREPSELKMLRFDSNEHKILSLSALSSSLFYWYYIVNSDCRNLNKREIISFPLPESLSPETYDKLRSILERLMLSYKENSVLRTVEYAKKGNITVQYFNFRPSKHIIDEIDRVLAQHYGFTDEELDFIINYDSKYRMGRDEGDESEE